MIDVGCSALGTGMLEGVLGSANEVGQQVHRDQQQAAEGA